VRFAEHDEVVESFATYRSDEPLNVAVMPRRAWRRGVIADSHPPHSGNDREIRDLIRRMSKETSLWGAPRIHGELLMLGIEVAQSTVARYMIRRQGPPSQGWKTFLRNHAAGIASIDLFVVRNSQSRVL